MKTVIEVSPDGQYSFIDTDDSEDGNIEQPQFMPPSLQGMALTVPETCCACGKKAMTEFLVLVNSVNLLRPGLVRLWVPGHEGCVPVLGASWDRQYKANHEHDWMCYY